MRRLNWSKAEAFLGEGNPNWKGNKVGMDGLHVWVAKRLPKPDACEICKEKKQLELSSKGHVYNRNLKSWQWLCRSCHSKVDQKIENILRNKKKKFCKICGHEVPWSARVKYCETCRITTRKEWWEEWRKKNRERRNRKQREAYRKKVQR